MIKLARALALVLATHGLVACGGEEDSFSNSLTFGTGIAGTGFTLVGEASTFSLSALGGKSLWFRLESAEDIDKRFVRLYFDDLTNKDFTAVQEYGHITLANFAVQNPGTFEVRGCYVKTVVDIGEETTVATAKLTLTP